MDTHNATIPMAIRTTSPVMPNDLVERPGTAPIPRRRARNLLRGRRGHDDHRSARNVLLDSSLLKCDEIAINVQDGEFANTPRLCLEMPIRVHHVQSCVGLEQFVNSFDDDSA